MEAEISEKEKERRRKISEYRKKVIEEKRVKGYKEYLKKKHAEKRKLEQKKRREKEKLKRKKEKEKELKKIKKKVGRPKKRGPKKKYIRKKTIPVKKIREKREYKYKIVSCKNGKQNKFIGKYFNIEDAYSVIESLKNKSEKVEFPQMVSSEKGYINSISEYILIEKTDDDSPVVLRNEYGKFVEQETNIDGWKIIDKFRYNVEETFWIYGYNYRTERKTFKWIYEELLLGDMYDFKRVILYKNKVIFKNDDNTFDIVFCKNESDSVRVYNALSSNVKKDKVKNIYFIGDYSEISLKRKQLEKELIDYTGWKLKKIQMKVNKFNPE